MASDLYAISEEGSKLARLTRRAGLRTQNVRSSLRSQSEFGSHTDHRQKPELGDQNDDRTVPRTGGLRDNASACVTFDGKERHVPMNYLRASTRRSPRAESGSRTAAASGSSPARPCARRTSRHGTGQRARGGSARTRRRRTRPAGSPAEGSPRTGTAASPAARLASQLAPIRGST